MAIVLEPWGSLGSGGWASISPGQTCLSSCCLHPIPDSEGPGKDLLAAGKAIPVLLLSPLQYNFCFCHFAAQTKPVREVPPGPRWEGVGHLVLQQNPVVSMLRSLLCTRQAGEATAA